VYFSQKVTRQMRVVLPLLLIEFAVETRGVAETTRTDERLVHESHW